jgi:hypothetical protein
MCPLVIPLYLVHKGLKNEPYCDKVGPDLFNYLKKGVLNFWTITTSKNKHLDSVWLKS